MKKLFLTSLKNISFYLGLSVFIGLIVGAYQLGITFFKDSSNFLYNSKSVVIIILTILLVIVLAILNDLILRFYPHMIRVANHPEKYSRDEQYDCAMSLIKKVFDKCKIKVEAYGLENIPKKDGFYLCSNHQEKFDPLAIWYTFPRQIGVILNDKATHRPFINEICKLIKSKRLIQKDVHSNLKMMYEIVDD